MYLCKHTIVFSYVLAITWVLVYRTDTYKRLKASIEKQSKRRMLLFASCHFENAIIVLLFCGTVERKKEAVTDISKQGGQKRKLGLYCIIMLLVSDFMCDCMSVNFETQ